MIIGNGQLASVFKTLNIRRAVIFASGVSNSTCKDINEFEREKNLLLKALVEHKEKQFVYFSSCALSAEKYLKNEYYLHKIDMENIIKKHSTDYFIFRLPQLFGKLKNHPTIINFFYHQIMTSKHFTVSNKAYRYVIDINDVKKVTMEYLSSDIKNITIDLANPYPYSALTIVKTLENLSGKKALYTIVDKPDGYKLDLTPLMIFIKIKKIDIDFSQDYLYNKLKSQFDV